MQAPPFQAITRWDRLFDARADVVSAERHPLLGSQVAGPVPSVTYPKRSKRASYHQIGETSSASLLELKLGSFRRLFGGGVEKTMRDFVRRNCQELGSFRQLRPMGSGSGF